LVHSLASGVLFIALAALFLYSNPQPDYNDILSVLIGALVTIVTVMFSAVLVALQLASAQFSPRITRGFFQQNRFVQMSFYAFLFGISLLLGIKFTRNAATGVFMFTWLPIVGTIFGFFLISYVLPRFVFYIADGINAATISNQIARNTLREITELYPEVAPENQPKSTVKIAQEPLAARVTSCEMGFLDSIDLVKLSQIASKNPELSFESQVMVGNFISPAETLLKISGVGSIPDSLITEIQSLFLLRKYRSYHQDILFGVRQLVDMGLKAISPAVNDPTTCVNCIHYLGTIVQAYAARGGVSLSSKSLPANVSLREFSFTMLLDGAFDQIYQYGRTDYVIVSQILNTLYEVSLNITDAQQKKAIREQVAEFDLDNQHFALAEHRDRVQRSLNRLMGQLG
jgi:uncharacterized membrane protein